MTSRLEISTGSMLSNNTTKSLSFDGLHGFTMKEFPSGTVIHRDNNYSSSDYCLIIQESANNIRWSFKFFDNLHMDLSVSTRDHLHKEIERIGRLLVAGRRRESQTVEGDETDSPIIDLEYKSVPTELDNGRDSSPSSSSSSIITKSTTPALLIIHEAIQKTDPSATMLVGRFLLPLRHGLFEVILTAESSSSSSSTSPTTTITNPQHWDDDSKNCKTKHPPQMDDCPRRIRTGVSWLSSTEAGLIVTDPPQGTNTRAGTEVELRQLRCRLILPPRFMYSPNPSSPESNKHRFCRASFGGSDGVQVIVVSCWYHGNSIKKGMKGLQQVALHGARVIHELQQVTNIQISQKEVRLKNRRRWLHAGNKDAIITTVNCQEAYGIRRQNTIGWVREANSGIIFLVYFIDTLGLDQDAVQSEMVETLASIRVPRLHPSPWNIQSLILNKTDVGRRSLRTQPV